MAIKSAVHFRAGFRDLVRRILPVDAPGLSTTRTETFERERAILWPIVRTVSHDLHHTGSTAVPNLPSKPIVDMMLEVYDVAAFDELRSALEAVGYIWCGETMPGCRYAYR